MVVNDTFKRAKELVQVRIKELTSGNHRYKSRQANEEMSKPDE